MLLGNRGVARKNIAGGGDKTVNFLTSLNL